MTPDLVDGLLISLIVSVMTVVLCPILCWVLPNRSKKLESGTLQWPSCPVDLVYGEAVMKYQ